PLRLGAEAFAAATALATPAEPVVPAVFGARLGGALTASAGSGPTPVGSFTLLARAEATLYPHHDLVQWGVRLNPAWRLTTGPLTATASYETWLTNAASPFAGLDRLSPLARSRASVRVEGELLGWETGDALSGHVGASAVHDGVPVANRAA